MEEVGYTPLKLRGDRILRRENVDAECDKCGAAAVVFRVVRGIPLYLCARCFTKDTRGKPEKKDKFKAYPREGTPMKRGYRRDRGWKSDAEDELWAKSQEETGR